MIYNFSDFFSNNIKAFLHCNPTNNNIKNIVDQLTESKKIAIPEQIHSTIVRDIKREGIFKKTDGLITSNKDIILTLKVADCVPIFLYDDKKKNFGLIHSGWKGTAGNIVLNGIKIMIEKKSNPEDIQVFLGPCIQNCCYDVNEDVASYFNKDSKIQNNKNKWIISLHNQIKQNLISFNIKKKNIKCSNICTLDTLECHSYRRDGKGAGRMIAVIGLI